MNDSELLHWIINCLLTDSQLDTSPPDNGPTLRYRGELRETTDEAESE